MTPPRKAKKRKAVKSFIALITKSDLAEFEADGMGSFYSKECVNEHEWDNEDVFVRVRITPA